MAKVCVKPPSATGVELSGLAHERLYMPLRSQIYDIRHVLLADSGLADQHDPLRELLSGMTDAKGKDALNNLGFTGWDMLQQEDTEFMIDLMDTLVN